MHLELRHTKADMVVKQAFIDDLRQQLAWVTDDRRQQLESVTLLRSSLAALQTQVNALCVYQNSAGFRIVERAIVAFKRIPAAHSVARRLARRLANTSGTRS
jgi:hypothetical protein